MYSGPLGLSRPNYKGSISNGAAGSVMPRAIAARSVAYVVANEKRSYIEWDEADFLTSGLLRRSSHVSVSGTAVFKAEPVAP